MPPRLPLRVPLRLPLSMTPAPTGATPAPRRVGILERLLPMGDQYQGLVSPEDADSARSDQLMRFGAGLLQGSGWSPMGTPMGVALGNAVQQTPDWNEVLGGIAKQNVGLRQAQKAQGLDAQRQQILSKYPAGPNETPKDTGARLLKMLPEFIQIGDTETVARLSELLKSMGFGDQKHETRGPYSAINPATGLPQQFDILPDGTRRWAVDPEGRPIRPTERTGQEQVETQRQFMREQQLDDDYYRRTKDIQEAYQFVDQTMNNIPLAKSGNGAAQVELLYAFVKALDPASVVREGEVSLARQATPFWSQARALINKYEQNQSVVVPPKLVEQIEGLLTSRLRGFEKRWNTVRSNIVRRAERWKIDPSTFIEAPTKYSNPTAAPAATGTVEGELRRLFPDSTGARP